jgi:hypothetical protein
MTIYADFNNRDESGFLRLNCDGTLSDLTSKSIVLYEGLQLSVSDGDLFAVIIVHAPDEELVWKGEIIGGISYLS